MQFNASVFVFLCFLYIYFLCLSSLFGAVKLLRFFSGQILKLVLKIIFKSTRKNKIKIKKKREFFTGFWFLVQL